MVHFHKHINVSLIFQGIRLSLIQTSPGEENNKVRTILMNRKINSHTYIPFFGLQVMGYVLVCDHLFVLANTPIPFCVLLAASMRIVVLYFVSFLAVTLAL